MALSTGDKALLTVATLGFAGFAYSMRPESGHMGEFAIGNDCHRRHVAAR